MSNFINKVFCRHVWKGKTLWSRIDRELYYSQGKTPYYCKDCGKSINTKEPPISYVPESGNDSMIWGFPVIEVDDLGVSDE